MTIERSPFDKLNDAGPCAWCREHVGEGHVDYIDFRTKAGVIVEDHVMPPFGAPESALLVVRVCQKCATELAAASAVGEAVGILEGETP